MQSQKEKGIFELILIKLLKNNLIIIKIILIYNKIVYNFSFS